MTEPVLWHGKQPNALDRQTDRVWWLIVNKCTRVGKEGGSDILSAHAASYTHNFVSGMQSFYFSESQGAMVLQTYNEK